MDVTAALFSGLAGGLGAAELGVTDGVMARVTVMAAGGVAVRVAGGAAVRAAGGVAARVAGGTADGVADRGGARVPSIGFAVMKRAKNMVWGVCPSRLVPSKGLEAGRVWINASANASRFCRVSMDGRSPRTRVFSWSSRHVDQMTQGRDVELGASNISPRSLRGYAGWVTMWCACSQLFTGRLGSRWSTCEYIWGKRGDCCRSTARLMSIARTALCCRCPWFAAIMRRCSA